MFYFVHGGRRHPKHDRHGEGPFPIVAGPIQGLNGRWSRPGADDEEIEVVRCHGEPLAQIAGTIRHACSAPGAGSAGGGSGGKKGRTRRN